MASMTTESWSPGILPDDALPRENTQKTGDVPWKWGCDGDNRRGILSGEGFPV